MRLLLDLLLPPCCAGCGQEGTVLCRRCRLPLRRRLHEPAGAPLGMPVTMPAGLLQLEWCAMYSGPTRAALHALKYRGERRLCEPLGTALAERWRAAGRGGDLITWVPVHRSRRAERGFDQAEQLARVMASQLRLPLERCLERRLRTVAQHSLGQHDRAGNTGGAFSALPGVTQHLPGSWIVLVDDIMTTGATLSSCAAALHAAGAAAVSAITLARDR
jgi:ComF family protein